MPFTPFHFGPGLLVGLVALRWVDFPTVLAGSVLVDVRAVLVFFGVLDGPLHGPVHTFLGAAVLGTILATVTVPLRPALDSVLVKLRIPQIASARRVTAGAFVGAWLHVVLDSILYGDMTPFFPLSGNPLLGLTSAVAVYVGCLVAGVAGTGLYAMSALGFVELSTPVQRERRS